MSNSARTKNTEAAKTIDGDSFAAGGRLNEQQFAEFFRMAQDSAQFLDRARTVDLSGPEQKIDKIGVGERIMRSATDGERGDLNDVSTGEVKMQVEEVEIPFKISRRVAEDTIEGENTAQTIQDLFVGQFGADSEDLGFNGDESSEDDFESINDGWIAIAEDEGADTVDAENEGVDKTIFSEMVTSLDDKYRRGDRDLVILSSLNTKQDYKEYLADRSSAAGDAMLMTGDEPTPFGYEMVTPVGFPDDMLMLTQPENLIWGVHRDVDLSVTTEGEAVVLERLWGIGNVTARTDYAIEDADGVVLAENLG